MIDRAAAPALVRAIGRWSLLAAIINGVVGSGIFGLPSAVAGLSGVWSPALVLLAGAAMFVVVLCFAEVGSRFDEAGGPYLYVREAFGSAAGFQVGWLLFVGRLLSAAAALNILVAYLGLLVPVIATSPGRTVVMVGAVVVVTALNVRGVRTAAWATNVFTIGKLAPLMLLVVLGLLAANRETMATQVVAIPDWREAMLLLVFAYGGFEAAIVAGGETRDPRRDTPFALLAGVAAVTAVYALLQFVVIGVLPNAASSSTPIAAALDRVIGPAGATLASIGVVISVSGWLTGFTLMMPRVLYSMALRGELPAFLGRVHPVYRTPHIAVVVAAGLALAAGLTSSFSQAAALAAVARLVVFLVTVATVVALRRQDGRAPFHVWGGPLVSAAAMMFCLWLLSTRPAAQLGLLVAAAGIGFVIHALGRRAGGVIAAESPSA